MHASALACIFNMVNLQTNSAKSITQFVRDNSFLILYMLVFIFFINVDIRPSLHALPLITRALKLTTI